MSLKNKKKIRVKTTKQQSNLSKLASITSILGNVYSNIKKSLERKRLRK